MGCTQHKLDQLPERFQNLDNITVYSADAEPVFQIQLKKVQKVGNTDANPIGTLKAVAVDNAQRLFIADAKQLNIKVYRPDGSFITQLGREGKGPGEFNELSNLEIKGTSYLLLMMSSSVQLCLLWIPLPLVIRLTLQATGITLIY
ncbi:MAG: 6-bladed beta-propeller [Fodinibius sp.]|nr:6-bladed beta-propeller [Fodinibius sp.]